MSDPRDDLVAELRAATGESPAASLREPSPSWIPRDDDERSSRAMPSAGFKDWREQAEWWQQTCEWWREQAERERARAESSDAVAKFAWKAVEDAEQREIDRG